MNEFNWGKSKRAINKQQLSTNKNERKTETDNIQERNQLELKRWI